MNSADKSMSIVGHFAELRRRVAIVAIILLVGTGAAVFFSRQIYSWLQVPLARALPETSGFIALSPVEGWLVYFKVSLVAAVFATSPLWLYQVWAFVAPGLYRRERFSLIAVGLVSAALFVGGAALCYYLIIPYGFSYFVSVLSGTEISLLPQMDLYLSFMLKLLVAFGIVFQVPLVIVFLVRWNVVPLEKMKKARPFVILIAFVLAAIITPPDVFTQIALAIPFVILFEISLLIAFLVRRK